MSLGETTRFDDAVFGPREVANEEIEDFVLLRSARDDAAADPRPTYQLAAVVDDIEMRITHVIRGADHISNTPKQVLLYRALGAAPSGLRPRSADSRRRSHASFQAPWRYQRRLLSRRRFSARGLPQFPLTPGLVAGRRLGILAHPRIGRALFARRRQPHQRGVRPRQARMVQSAIPAKASHRGDRSRRPVASSNAAGLWRPDMGRAGIARRPKRLVCADGGSAAPAHAPAARFLHLGARIFFRRFRLRPGRARQILER